MNRKPFYLTTAIAYTNARPHIGFALELLYSDVMARYQRLLGNEVRFLTGTDEHGQKILKTAKEQGKDARTFVDENSAVFQSLADRWNISNDDFIRTTEDRHIKGAQAFWKVVAENGHIYKKTYTGLYCVGCESFKTEKDLVNGKCPDHNREPETVSEENYFFRLSSFQEPLEFLFENQPNFVFPDTRFNEMKGILKAGLEDVSISRSKEKLPWGIPVPGDDSQVMYVWFDALTNYITALNYGGKSDADLVKYWPTVTHVVGKEINRFHAILWPAMLMAAQMELPRQIAVHGWITVDGQKMSKSLGNVIDPLEIVGQYPLEAVRYFLMREIPFDNDGNFSHKQFQERFNGDLANGLGNLTNRVLTMIEKYSGGVVPAVTTPGSGLADLLVETIWPLYIENMGRWRFDLALEATWKFLTACDQMISDREPWAMAKAGKMTEVHDLLYHLAEALRHIAIMIYPVMPETSEKIITQLGLSVEKEFAKPLLDLQQWVDLTVGNTITKGEPLFPRLEIKA
jgi:methionyl-tRNA synthetase